MLDMLGKLKLGRNSLTQGVGNPLLLHPALQILGRRRNMKKPIFNLFILFITRISKMQSQETTSAFLILSMNLVICSRCLSCIARFGVQFTPARSPWSTSIASACDPLLPLPEPGELPDTRLPGKPRCWNHSPWPLSRLIPLESGQMIKRSQLLSYGASFSNCSSIP